MKYSFMVGMTAASFFAVERPAARRGAGRSGGFRGSSPFSRYPACSRRARPRSGSPGHSLSKTTAQSGSIVPGVVVFEVGGAEVADDPLVPVGQVVEGGVPVDLGGGEGAVLQGVGQGVHDVRVE